ncbi:hypothetical protein Hanom_Chr02g00102391 [Helianthus anomalus]
MSTSFNSNPRSPATSSRLQLSGVGSVSVAPSCNRRLFIFFADFRSWKLIGSYFRSFQNSTECLLIDFWINLCIVMCAANWRCSC